MTAAHRLFNYIIPTALCRQCKRSKKTKARIVSAYQESEYNLRLYDMTGRTHLAAGVFTGIALATLSGQAKIPTITIIAASVLGSVLPDIDHPKAMISATSLSARTFSGAISAITKHRGITHTPVFVAIITYFAAALLSRYISCPDMAAEGLCTGMLSHLLLDSLNDRGIMWLWPLSKKPIHLLNLRTGSFADKMLRYLLYGAATVAFFFYASVVLGV